MSYEGAPHTPESSPDDNGSKSKKGEKKKAAGEPSGADRTESERQEAPKPPVKLAKLLEGIVARPEPTGEKPSDEKGKAEKAAGETEALAAAEQNSEHPEVGAADSDADSAETMAIEAHSQLDEAEEHEVDAQLVAAGQADAVERHDQFAPGTPEAVAAALDAEFLAGVSKEVAAGVPMAEATAAAYQQVTGAEAPPLAENVAPAADENAPAPGEAPSQNIPDDAEEDQGSAAAAAAAPGGGGSGRRVPPAGMVPGFASGSWNRQPGAGPGGEMISEVTARGRESRAAVSGLLVGGILGFIIGRRYERRKWKPQLKEAKVVEANLRRQIQDRDDLLEERRRQVEAFALERIAEQQLMPAAAAAGAAEAVAPRPEQPREPQPAAPPAERITSPVSRVEKVAGRPESTKNLPLPAVLKLAEEIVVDDQNVREIYEENLISEQGLRRIVDEHLRGGNTEHALNEERAVHEMQHEIHFEHDPAKDASHDAALRALRVIRGESPEDAQARSANEAETAPAVTVPAPVGQLSEAETRKPPSVMFIANIIAFGVLALAIIILLIIWLSR